MKQEIVFDYFQGIIVYRNLNSGIFKKKDYEKSFKKNC